MQNGGKYIPPHLRGSQGRGGSNNNNSERNIEDNVSPQKSFTSSRAGYGSSDRGGSHSGERRSYNNSRGGGRNDQRTSDRTFDDRVNTPNAPLPVTNSRWSSVDMGTSGGGGGESRRSNASYGGRRDSYAARRNERGLHGDMRENKRLEKELFEQEFQQKTGINFDNYDKIPVESSGNDIPEPIDSYSAETVGPDLFRNVQLCGYTKPTPVQKWSVPIGVNGRDLMACAQTGSGKTAGFLFPIIMNMVRNGGSEPPSSARRRVYPEALILAPTRELASQIQEEAKKFTYCTGIASVVVYGGAEVREQLRAIEHGCDLLVATPGRLVDLIERGRIGLDNIRFLVLDEADRMLDMGFEPQIRRIVEQEGMPSDIRQTMMFSATFPPNIQRLASDFLCNYIFLTVGRVGSASKDVSQEVEYVENNDKMEHLMKFLLTVQEGLILIFVETKRSCDYVEDVLCAKGFPACSIHGDKCQREREDSLKSFKNGRTPVMVATDVASRGLDIPNVTQVVNFDLPTNIDDYVHRIGRTGRAGNTGAALSYVNERNSGIIRDLYDLLDENTQEIPAWFKSMVDYSSNNKGGGRRGGRNNFGSRDYRTQDSQGGSRRSGGGGNSNSRNTGYGSSYGGGYGSSSGGGGGGYGGGTFGNSAW